ncbi:MAG: hypothetical protein AAGG56_08630 [Pseudomonadota bacterium]
MKPGILISGTAHGALVAAAVFGLPWLSPSEPELTNVTSVSFVSDAEFERARTAAALPSDPGLVVLPPETALEPEMPTIVPEQRPEPAPEAAPESAAFAPQFRSESPLASSLPDFPAVSPELVTVQPPSRADAPLPRPVDRVAPNAQPTPSPEAFEAAEVAPEVSPSPEESAQAELQVATAPAAVAPEPVAEAVPEAPEALVSVAPPPTRPARPASVAALDPPSPSALEPAPQADRQSQLEALVASANRATAPTAPTQTAATAASPAQGASDGPPLTAGERDGLRLAVQQCWNLPAGLREASELKVTLAAQLTRSGAVLPNTIRLVEPNPVPDSRYQRAFDAGRRALIRCSPYSGLPADKYAQWRSLEIVFNPEGMVSW